MTNSLYLLTGSNIEPRLEFLDEANRLIETFIGAIMARSSVYESAPWGFEAPGRFLNQVVKVESEHEAEEVLSMVLGIERQMGRVRRNQGYESRVIDIDVLYFNDEVIKTGGLEIPHPRLHLRRFTLLPLTEIAGDFMHPSLQLSNKDLLTQCPEDPSIQIFGKV
jgi:2-amino-4-hydroxy-6-hydroxymethyldihydropteridine diphosphokinase